MVKYISLMALLVAGCDVSPDDALRTTHALGFSNVELGGHAWFGCGDDYPMSTNFTAKNANGELVSGVVCCGWLKSCTVKF